MWAPLKGTQVSASGRQSHHRYLDQSFPLWAKRKCGFTVCDGTHSTTVGADFWFVGLLKPTCDTKKEQKQAPCTQKAYLLIRTRRCMCGENTPNRAKSLNEQLVKAQTVKIGSFQSRSLRIHTDVERAETIFLTAQLKMTKQQFKLGPQTLILGLRWISNSPSGGNEFQYYIFDILALTFFSI